MKKNILCLSIVLVLLTGCDKKPKNLDFDSSVDNNTKFEFVKPSVIEDNYLLNLGEDKDDYFKNNIVELSGIVPVSSYEIMINNNVLFDLKELFDSGDYKSILVRRGYLDDIDSKSQKAYDHKTGYDIDVYVKGKQWTDFEGNDDANKLIQNSYKYGFVLRYTDEKDYQPWHYRYIGKVHAKIMHDENLTLSQYLNELAKFKDKNIYKSKDTNDYVYKVSKKDIVVPKGYNYSISSIDKDYYVINFNTDKTVNIKETDSYKGIVNKAIDKLTLVSDLILVNDKYEVKKLNDIKLVNLTQYLTNDNNPEYLLDEDVLKQLKPMLETTNKLDRHTTYLTSSYRTYDEQKELYDKGEKGYVQIPGHSEHETGLAFDLSNSFKDNTKFLETAQGVLIKNIANQYGFILRYPSGKKDITGIDHEQWHFRYVGELHATYIKENNIVLEEYLNKFELNKFYEVSFEDNKYIFYKSKLNNNKISTFKDNDKVYYICNDEYLSIIEK